jgi:putative membrane protein
MRKLAISVAAATLLVGAPVLAQSVGEKAGINSALDISPTTADFVKEAASSDMLEIAAAKVAEEKGNADEKHFAAQMVTDHTKSSSELKGMVSRGDVKEEIPTVLDSAALKQLDKLKETKPDNFASEYDPMQVSAHKDAVSLFERYSKSGDNAVLKDWAGKTLPTLQHHLEMAHAMNKNRD